MNKTTVYLNSKGAEDLNYKGIEVVGHTKKEVCNGISALTWTLAEALRTETEGEVEVYENDDHMIITLKCNPTERTNLIFKTVVTGLSMTQTSNPEHMYKIEYKAPKELVRA